MTIKKLSHLSLLGLTCLITACESGALFRPSMYDHTLVTQREMTLSKKRYVDTRPTSEITYDYLVGLSDDYDHHGASPVYVVVAYDPAHKHGKLEAFNQSNILRGQLAKLGMTSAVVKTMPIQGSEKLTVIGYDRVTVKGPENCGKVPGYTTETGAYGDYGLGCSVKDAMAQQIAYPADLSGKQDIDMGDTDSDRAANAVSRDVRSGEVSDFVPSYILSDLAGNTTE